MKVAAPRGNSGGVTQVFSQFARARKGRPGRGFACPIAANAGSIRHNADCGDPKAPRTVREKSDRSPTLTRKHVARARTVKNARCGCAFLLFEFRLAAWQVQKVLMPNTMGTIYNAVADLRTDHRGSWSVVRRWLRVFSRRTPDSDEEFDFAMAALGEYGVLRFPRQRLTAQQLKDFSARSRFQQGLGADAQQAGQHAPRCRRAAQGKASPASRAISRYIPATSSGSAATDRRCRH